MLVCDVTAILSFLVLCYTLRPAPDRTFCKRTNRLQMRSGYRGECHLYLHLMKRIRRIFSLHSALCDHCLWIYMQETVLHPVSGRCDGKSELLPHPGRWKVGGRKRPPTRSRERNGWTSCGFPRGGREDCRWLLGAAGLFSRLRLPYDLLSGHTSYECTGKKPNSCLVLAIVGYSRVRYIARLVS